MKHKKTKDALWKKNYLDQSQAHGYLCAVKARIALV